MARTRLPTHVGFIPDGNRRWAVGRGMARQDGYRHGLDPGRRLYRRCVELGIPEVSVYGFTQDNTRRPSAQAEAFRAACVDFALWLDREGAALRVVGDAGSTQFPDELRPFVERRDTPGIRVNFLVNYGWEWDLQGLAQGRLRSHDVRPLELIVRWGGGRRLSGFLPVQSVYADFYVVDEWWPDYRDEHFDAALEWFAAQDRTLGG
ncbi:MAG TPA: undecaprenyl diphosphate synthase family protein [Burkholderiaceae bacterium]|nr:undecaprenyl diphosphate synthase family protein [Burkholderiaceae bacterium]